MTWQVGSVSKIIGIGSATLPVGIPIVPNYRYRISSCKIFFANILISDDRKLAIVHKYEFIQ